MHAIRNKWSVIFFGLILGLVSSGVSMADEEPLVMLENVTGQMMDALRTHRGELHRDPSKIYALVDHIILTHVDFTEMARWVVGRNAWLAANSETQQAFVNEFKNLVVRSYARTLLEYTDQQIEFLPMRESVGSQKRIQIQSLIKEQGKAPIHMDYNLLREGNAWRVYDIVIEGVSLMQGYRAQFIDDIRTDGIKAVIEKMRQRNAGN
jgi:phospholipid transport system substrate-binding protein